jgi:hypothetical protein
MSQSIFPTLEPNPLHPPLRVMSSLALNKQARAERVLNG